MTQMNKVRGVATTVRNLDNVISVVYHQTEVVNVANGIVTLNTDGWKTATTKARMNQAANEFDLPFSVYQERKEWFVGLHTDSQRFAKKLPFTSDSLSFAL